MADKWESKMSLREDEAEMRSYIAVDIPSPVMTANALAVRFPSVAMDVARAVRCADGSGYRVRRGVDDLTLRVLRSTGIIDVPGHEPSAEHIAAGHGWRLGVYGGEVRLAIIDILARAEQGDPVG